MNGENQPVVADEPVEFDKWPIGVQDFGKITRRFRGIYRIYHKFPKKKPEDHNI